MSVRHVELEREGAEWTCDGGIECKDDAKGSRGKDMLWWPKGADCKTPRVLFVHGGGWQHHGPKEASYDVFAAKLSQVSGAIIMVPDYLLVPLGNFLSITDYLLKAWDFLTTHGPAGDECSGTPPLFVAGDSSGAASALSMLLRLRQQGFPEASGFFAFSPWMNLACDSPTYYSNAFTLVDDTSGQVMDGDILFRGPPQNVSKSLQQLALKYFQGDVTRLKDPLYSPFHATEEQLDALPPVYLAVSGSEVMTGDSMIFAQRAAVRGVRVYVSMFPGMWHGFPQYIEGCGSGTELWQGTTALSHAGDFVSQISAYLRSRSYRAYINNISTSYFSDSVPAIPSSTFGCLMADKEESGVRLGRYVGRKSDHSCPGDHVTWEIVLAENGFCTIECRSELSPSKGGTQAWHVEGTWEEDDDEVVVAITKEDPLGGPRSGAGFLNHQQKTLSPSRVRSVNGAVLHQIHFWMLCRP
eukprot:symbB.v1.2.009647.t1/scaffold616.1/size180385/3